MPIFQDPDRRFPQANQPLTSSRHGHTPTSKPSEESIGTEFCDGFWPDVPPFWTGGRDQAADLEGKEPLHQLGGVCTSDRNELMERIKRGESATWVPSRTLQEEFSKHHQEERSFTPSSESTRHERNARLPLADFQNIATTADDSYATQLSPPLQIKRPRSALHAGDFTKDSVGPTSTSQQSQPSPGSVETSAQAVTEGPPAGAWDIPSPPHHHTHVISPTPARPALGRPGPLPARTRAPSLSSLPSSYVVKAPTTPLVQQCNNTDLDFSPVDRSISPTIIIPYQSAPVFLIRSFSATACVNAQIGVMVFYSWNGSTGRNDATIGDEPSPYVGHIDLSQLPAPAESKKTRRSRSKSPSVDKGGFVHLQDETTMESDRNVVDVSRRHKKRRRTSPPPSDLQGGYRIPQKGQLQIVIKNPNKTAVKLFLVPYDLEDMPVGTKTFIRQRCCSTDPVADGHSSEHKFVADSSTGSAPPKVKPTLRYLIHLKICSPSSGRFYLYQIIRVVFANRVPDNKEQLQTEIQTPQPRYSTYSSSHSLLSRSISSSEAGLTRDKAYPRRSSVFGVGSEGTDDRYPQAFPCGQKHSSGFCNLPPPVPGIPRQFTSFQTSDSPCPVDVTYGVGKDRVRADSEDSPFPQFGGLPATPTPVFPTTSIPIHQHRFRNDVLESQRPAEDQNGDLDGFSRPTTSSSYQVLQSPLSDKSIQRGLHSKRSDSSHSSGEYSPYSKLTRWDVGYGGRPSSPMMPRTGLLTTKLKGLGVQGKAAATSDDDMDE
ncbi:MAG: hypothetical protein Q9205_001986 [Flavoplaca limonia]